MTTAESSRRRYGLLAIVVALAAWAIYHAIGLAVYNRRPLHGLVVLASFAIFLGVWGLLLAARRRRTSRR